MSADKKIKIADIDIFYLSYDEPKQTRTLGRY